MSEGRRLGFVADSRGTVAEIVLSEAVSRAWDIMAADGVTAEKAAEMAAAAERGGRDPVAFAEHFVKVRREFRASRAGTGSAAPDQVG